LAVVIRPYDIHIFSILQFRLPSCFFLVLISPIMQPTSSAHLLVPTHAEQWHHTLNWCPTTAQQDLFQQLYDQIVQGNRQLNLTRITEPEEFWEKHLWDSLVGIAAWLTPEVDDDPSVLPRSVVDIGTGGGFPGIPVAIAHPHWSVTLLDSTRKKITFLETLIQTLGLVEVNTWCDRAETVGHHPQHREQYDIALIRAVGEASVCAEYALPLVKVGGQAILYRGHWSEDDTPPLEAAVRQLGGAIATIQPWETPLSFGVRHCITLTKVAPTPNAFPRAVGIPKQNPLGMVAEL
jgi:16S rRNA (guanine527-N7)-methyltransferase